jgi:predicted PurR-regulated permease PerM
MLAFDRQAARVTWTVAVVSAGLYAAYSIRRTLLVFVLAVFFSYLLYPAVRQLERFVPQRLSRTASTAVIFVLLLLGIAGIAALVGPAVADQGARLAEKLPELTRDPKLIEHIPLPGWLLPFRDRIAAFARENLVSGTALAVPAAKQVGQVLLGIAGNAIFVVLIPLLAFLFIKDGGQMRDGFLGWIAGAGRGSMWRRIVGDLDITLGHYIRALLILSGATLVVYGIFFSVAGVPYGLLLAAVACVLEFIPVVGPLAAALAVLVVAALSGYDHLLLVIGFIGGYRLFQDYVLNPMLMSGGVAVPPLLVLFGLLAGEEIAGVAGIFLSVPVLAAAKIIATRVSQELDKAAAARAVTANPSAGGTEVAVVPASTPGAAGDTPPAVLVVPR